MSDNSKKALTAWGEKLITESKLTGERNELAKRIIDNAIESGNMWRGDISEELIKQGFTSEEFNYDLYL